MKQLHTEIEIAAPATRVWQVLTDFAAYPEWNPLIVEARGEAAAGKRLRIRVRLPGWPAMAFRPTVLHVEPERELRWLGSLGVPGLFDGEHFYQIEPAGEGGVKLIQGERFSGILVPLFGKMLVATRRGFEEMNAVLKARAEA